MADSLSATAWWTGGGGKYPLFAGFVLSFEKPGLAGDGSPLVLSPLLLGGVLKGDRSTLSGAVSGAKLARVAASTECDFGTILGLPARFTGGGTGGADDTGRSLFCGSFRRFGLGDGTIGVEESKAAWDVVREGCGA